MIMRKNERKRIMGESNQKCWHCKNITTCDWGKYGKPVEGWKARKVKKRLGHEYKETYDIIDCPEFETGETETNIQNYDKLIIAIVKQWRDDFVSVYLNVLIEEYRLGKATKLTRAEYETERKKAVHSILSDLLGERDAETAIESAESDAEMYFDIMVEWANGADEKEIAEKVGKDRFSIAKNLLKRKEPFRTKRIESLKRQGKNDII